MKTCCIFILCFILVRAQNRPQTPKPPFPYESEDVTYENEKIADVILAGTLTYPKDGVNSKVCVVLTPGSGGQTRDEEILGHKIFAVLGDHLTRNNITVLRYDERGIGESTGNFKDASYSEFADDLLAGIKYMRERNEFKRCKFGIIGHSKGGVTAMLAANSSKLVDFIVLLGSPASDAAKLLEKQTYLVEKSYNTSDENIAAVIKYMNEVFKIVKTTEDRHEMKDKLIKVLKEYMNGTFKDGDEIRMLSYIDPWFKDLLTMKFKNLLRNIKIPVLGLWGSLDLQVPAKENIRGAKEGLKLAGNRRFTLLELENINHLFQTAITGSPAEYNLIEETFSMKALEIISKWIKKNI